MSDTPKPTANVYINWPRIGHYCYSDHCRNPQALEESLRFIVRRDEGIAIPFCPACIKLAIKDKWNDAAEVMTLEQVQALQSKPTPTAEDRRKAREAVHASDEGTFFLCPGCRRCERVAQALADERAEAALVKCCELLRSRIEISHEALAWAYQFVGARGGTKEEMDNLSAALHGGRAPHQWTAVQPLLLGSPTFEQYWTRKGHLGCNPEEVARLSWEAAIRSVNAALSKEETGHERALVALQLATEAIRRLRVTGVLIPVDWSNPEAQMLSKAFCDADDHASQASQQILALLRPAAIPPNSVSSDVEPLDSGGASK